MGNSQALDSQKAEAEETARDFKPSLQNVEAKISAMGWELTSSGWVNSERWLHSPLTSLTHPLGQPNGNAGGGVPSLVWPSAKSRGAHPVS